MSEVPAGAMGDDLQKAAAEVAVKHLLTREGLMKVVNFENLNAFFGVVVLAYLVIVSLQCLLFSFTYSVYTLLVAVVVAVGEVGTLLTCGFLKQFSDVLTPVTKGFLYACCSLGGIGCFVNFSWNPLLLIGHLGVGLLGYRHYISGASAPKGAEKILAGDDAI
eukprot:TRINITY_DN113285_c0_g1_i1.p2 TRINITY_DN113285_c0_g1~~TRINITY_DN113285_c0_g1_i1.p2  ORF type:complete len:163 (-),score=45.55 TRINITY_DN113285_c0_g1_i1:147-635(-)